MAGRGTLRTWTLGFRSVFNGDCWGLICGLCGNRWGRWSHVCYFVSVFVVFIEAIVADGGVFRPVSVLSTL